MPPEADAEEEIRDPPAPSPRILLPDPDEWGGAGPADVRAVLESAGAALLQFVPDADRPTIVVRAQGGPMAVFERTPEGHLLVLLATGGLFWSQYAFQFAHELCHHLCRCDPASHKSKHHFFEEALCETASLFVLRQMAHAWEEAPPYPNWRSYASSLREYAAKRMAESPRPQDLSLPVWFDRHRASVEEQPSNRDFNVAIAARLLAVFEARPERWGAVHWLNCDAQEPPRTFREHLMAWKRHAPPAHASTVDAVAAAFGMVLE